jgi:hypothetical protein
MYSGPSKTQTPPCALGALAAAGIALQSGGQALAEYAIRFDSPAHAHQYFQRRDPEGDSCSTKASPGPLKMIPLATGRLGDESEAYICKPATCHGAVIVVRIGAVVLVLGTPAGSASRAVSLARMAAVMGKG